jgi:hypothetical protein
VSDEFEIRSAELGEGPYSGVTVAAIGLQITAESGPEAEGKMRAFIDELHELLEAHPGIEVVKGRRAQIACFENVLRVRYAIERADAAERAARQ